MDLSSSDPARHGGREKKSIQSDPAGSVLDLPSLQQSILLAHTLNRPDLHCGRSLPANLDRALVDLGVSYPLDGTERRFVSGWRELSEIVRQHDDDDRLAIVQCAREVQRALPGVGLPLTFVHWFVDRDVAIEGSREFRKLLQALKERLVPLGNPSALVSWFDERKSRIVESRNLRLALGGGTDVVAADRAWSWMVEGPGRVHDWPIAASYELRRERLEERTWSLYRRLVTHAENFWRLSGEMRNRPGRPSLFGRFLTECFEKSSLLHSTDPNASPGQGYSASNFRMARTLSGLTVGDRVVRDAFAHFGRAVELAPKLNFAAVRGGWLLHHPMLSPRIDGLRDTALFVANDHLSASYDLGFRVPISRVTPSIVSARYDSGAGVSPTTGDLSRSGISAGKFAIDVAEPHIVNLTSISALLGGAVCGLPREAPLFDWEDDEEFSDQWRDFRGRHHFAALLELDGLWLHDSTRSEVERCRLRDETLGIYEEASLALAETSHELLNLLDLVLHRYGAWKGGHFGVSEPRLRRQAPQILEEVYFYHRQVSEGLMQPHETPVVAMVHRFDRGSSPELVLDPSTLVLYRESKAVGLLPPTLESWDLNAGIEWGRHLTSRLYRHGERPREFAESDYELCLVKRVYL